MRKLINFILNLAIKAFSFKFKSFEIGENTQIFSWRVKGNPSGTIVVGSDSIVKSQIYFERPDAVVKIGNRSFVGKGMISVADQVEIGNDVMISWGLPLLTTTPIVLSLVSAQMIFCHGS